MIQRFSIACCCTLVLLGGFAPAQEPSQPETIRVEFAMHEDPRLDESPVRLQLNTALLPLWLKAMQRPEADYQRLAAGAIAEAAEAGFPDLDPAIDPLQAILTAEQTHPDVRVAAARALIALDSRDSAPLLLEKSQSSTSPLRLLVEPALAAWKFEPALPIWRERVRDPQSGRRELIMALDGLAQLQDAEALDAIRTLVHSGDQPADVRLAAARSAGAVSQQGLEPDARQLMEHPRATPLHQLCAVALLKRHASPAAQKLLIDLADDDNPAVAEQALGILFDIDPSLVLPLADAAMQNADPKVRRRGADALVALPDPQRVERLALLLDDRHPEVRRSVRDDLYRLTRIEELDEPIRAATRNMLNGESWRGQEQAAILLGALDHEPAAGRMLELLSADRPEVKVAVAWGLKKLAIPETAPEMFEHTLQETKARRAGTGTAGLDEQVAHLFEALAILDFEPADSLLREYVPKNFINGYYSRGAAIWALGLMYTDQPEESLVALLVDRLNDMDPVNPDVDIVYEMSAMSLGRINAANHQADLEARLKTVSEHERFAYAIRWALGRITGQPVPAPGPVVRSRSGWFLEPAAARDPVRK
ncbi:HEAT repeat domain-containing protein [Maioricimonas sp. JC845]|uniref:HEAT repeat domain-containing protein n=1 Tax=Maioricimonas sp. JC845 TaxID=3232138 RepID=UPI00345B3D75